MAVSKKTPGFIFAKAFCPAAYGADTRRKRKIFGAEKANAGNVFYHFGCGLGKIKPKMGISCNKIQEIKCGTANKTRKQKKK